MKDAINDVPRISWIKAKTPRLCLALSLLLLCLISTIATNSQTQIYLMTGGSVGAVSSLIVIISYLSFPIERGPPLGLVFWRAVCDLGVALRFLATPGLDMLVCQQPWCMINNNAQNADDIVDISGDQNNCTLSTFFLEFFELTSEAWFFCIALDLLFSLSNPFSSYFDRVKKYHAGVWTFGVIMACCAMIPSISGYWFVTTEADSLGVCWIQSHKIPNFVNYKPYVFFYVPMMIIYVFSLGVTVYAFFRLRKGLSKTMVLRIRILISNSTNVVVCLLYWFVLGLIYGLAFIVDNATQEKWLFRLLLFLLSAKGFSAVLVWILLTGLNLGDEQSSRENSNLNSALRNEIMQYATTGIKYCASKSSTFDDSKRKVTFDLSHRGSEKNHISAWVFFSLLFGNKAEIEKLKNWTKETSEQQPNAQQQSANPDPRGYPSLSSERPTEASVRHTDLNITMHLSESEQKTEALDEVTHSSHGTWCVWFSKAWKRSFGTSVDVVDFTEFEPYHFRRIRESANISDEFFKKSFDSTMKERLTQGGASGAFFFFSDKERFIAKSCTEEEMLTLTRNATTYADYLTQNPNSFISKIYGVYRLRLHGIALHFFVMMNIFLNDEDLELNEKYDIKGSWVKRNATTAVDGQSVTCTHCGQKFIYRKKHSRRGMINRGKRTSMAVNPLNSKFEYPARQSFQLKEPILSSEVDDDMRRSKTAISLEEGSAYTASSSADSDRCRFTVRGNHEPNVILKDNDLKYKLKLPGKLAREVRDQLEQDAIQLARMGIMDYSLLVGVHKTEFAIKAALDAESAGGPTPRSDTIVSTESTESKDEFPTDMSIPVGLGSLNSGTKGVAGGLVAHRMISSSSKKAADETLMKGSRPLEVSKVVGPDVYFMGIIDYLQEWTWAKKMERLSKIVFQRADPEGLSAIQPDIYMERFVTKVDDILEVDLD